MATEILGGFVKDAFPELFVEGQVVSAEQSFHRRLAEYEMRLGGKVKRFEEMFTIFLRKTMENNGETVPCS